jgi:D-beta-D-heptose 7-phosphate kinase/D-beta-D-heptose 1-phosphate adenosyltransferase
MQGDERHHTVRIDYARLKELVPQFRERRVMVVGDLMLDAYLFGKAERISPEAPVPVVVIEEEGRRLGGAGNVVHNVRALGAEAVPVGVVGEDMQGQAIIEELEQLGVATEGIVVDPIRPTTSKIRVVAHQQQVVRADREQTTPLRGRVAKKLCTRFRKLLPDMDAVILQDYNKGVLTPGIIEEVTRLATGEGKLVTADPKFENFFLYKSVYLFKPNRRETEVALGRPLRTKGDLEKAGREMLRRLGCHAVLLTGGEEGMWLCEDEGPSTYLPTRAREVYDVSGAGDTVISVVTLAAASGATLKEAAWLANHAAGVEVAKFGISTVSPEELVNSLSD